MTISKINLKFLKHNFKMAAIYLYEKFKFSYLHPQMSSVQAEYAHHTPSVFVHWSLLHGKKMLTEKNIQ